MPAFAIPLIIQGGEALVVGLLAFFGAHQAGADWQSSIIAGASAAVGKVLPKQIVGGNKNAKPS